MLSAVDRVQSCAPSLLLAGIERHVPIEAQVLVHDIGQAIGATPAEATYSADELAISSETLAQLGAIYGRNGRHVLRCSRPL